MHISRSTHYLVIDCELPLILFRMYSVLFAVELWTSVYKPAKETILSKN